MNAEDIERNLMLIGRKLEELGLQEPIEVLMIGGGYMLTQVRNRTFTEDIDVVWLYPKAFGGPRVYLTFTRAIDVIANEENLPANWLNIEPNEFILLAGSLPKMKLWKRFGLLHVYLPPKDFILAHKLMAARKKDIADTKSLCVKLHVDTREKAQRIVDKYIDEIAQEINEAAKKLDKWFGVGEEATEG